MSLPEPELGDLADFIGALALGAMGKMQIPGETVPVDRPRAKWFIDLLGVVERSLAADVEATQRQRIEAVLAQLRLAFVEGS